MDQELQFNHLLRSAAILVVDDEPGMCNFLKKALESRCALLEIAASAEEAESLRLRYHFDLLLVDIRLPGLSGLDWLSRLRERGVQTHVIYMTAYADLEMAVGALRNGADDFIMKPFRIEQILTAIRHTLTQGQILRENSLLRLQLTQLNDTDGIVGESEPMKALLQQLRQLAPSRSPVTISGDTGTGKSLLARTLHHLSRRQGPLVVVDCAALDNADAESDLFTTEGMVSQAERGTLLLDGLAELSESMQTRLMYLLEHARLPGAGSVGAPPLDIRVVVTTERDLRLDVDSGVLRADLFFRLSALRIDVPALKDRGEDLRLLVDHFMQLLSSDMRVSPVSLLHTDWERLRSHTWPGNVQELRNLIERTLLLGHLPPDSLQPTSVSGWQGTGYPLTWSLEQVERQHIEAVLASVNHNKSAAARILGVSRKTIERKEALWHGTADET